MIDFATIKAINDELKGQPVMAFFSCGKDSIVTMDLLFRFYKGPITPVYLYFVPGLDIRESVINFYERKYNTKVKQYLHPQMGAFLNGKKTGNLAQAEHNIRGELEISFVASGVKKSDSLFRRGMLKACVNGIDWKQRKVYPVLEWKDPEIWRYIKKEKLKTPVDYDFGFKRENNIPKGESLLWIKRNFYSDYQKIIEYAPVFEMEAMKAQLYQEKGTRN